MNKVETGKVSEDVFEEVLSKTPEDLEEWIQDQDLSDQEKELWLFHYWMRNHTDLSSGTIVDYRKELATHWGEMQESEEKDSEELSSQRKSALSKYREFLDSDFLKNLEDIHSKTEEKGE